MTNVEAARTRWMNERDQHVQFAILIASRIEALAKAIGVYTEVSARAKEPYSLVKKLILKPGLTYESLPDKVGARIVVRYLCDLPAVKQRVMEEFSFAAIDDKGAELGENKVGYKSIHVDHVALRHEDTDAQRFPPEQFFAEVQLRTLAQHLWSEVSHDTFYKNDDLVNKLPADLKRRVHLTAGLVEVADREFNRMSAEAKPTPAAEIYGELEKLYYSVASQRPDVSLSLEVIDLILPLYGKEQPADVVHNHVRPTFEKYRDALGVIYAAPETASAASAFFFQPEALLILDRLEFDRDQLHAKWNERFPEAELERVATNLGFALG